MFIYFVYFITNLTNDSALNSFVFAANVTQKICFFYASIQLQVVRFFELSIIFIIQKSPWKRKRPKNFAKIIRIFD